MLVTNNGTVLVTNNGIVLVTNNGTVLVTNVGTVVGFKSLFFGEVKIHGGLRNLFLVKKPLRTKK